MTRHPRNEASCPATLPTAPVAAEIKLMSSALTSTKFNPSNHARHAEGAGVNRKQKFSRSENTLLLGLKQIMG